MPDELAPPSDKDAPLLLERSALLEPRELAEAAADVPALLLRPLEDNLADDADEGAETARLLLDGVALVAGNELAPAALEDRLLAAGWLEGAALLGVSRALLERPARLVAALLLPRVTEAMLEAIRLLAPALDEPVDAPEEDGAALESAARLLTGIGALELWAAPASGGASLGFVEPGGEATQAPRSAVHTTHKPWLVFSISFILGATW